MLRPISRRQTLILGGAVLAAAGTGGVLLATAGDKRALTRAVLERLVGPFRMANSSLDEFVAMFDQAVGFPSGLKGNTLAMIERLLGANADAVLPADAADRMETFERMLLTRFVMSTDVLARKDPSEPVSYIGLNPACSSPFARFDSEPG